MDVVHVIVGAAASVLAVVGSAIGYVLSVTRELAVLRERVASVENWRIGFEKQIVEELREIKRMIAQGFDRFEELSERLVRVEVKQEDAR